MILSDMALFLGEGLPAEWKLVISGFKDLLLGVKDLDPKNVVEWAYDVRNWHITHNAKRPEIGKGLRKSKHPLIGLVLQDRIGGVLNLNP
jgi:hypothetical protein